MSVRQEEEEEDDDDDVDRSLQNAWAVRSIMSAHLFFGNPKGKRARARREMCGLAISLAIVMAGLCVCV